MRPLAHISVPHQTIAETILEVMAYKPCLSCFRKATERLILTDTLLSVKAL
jgi:hypothetical protein